MSNRYGYARTSPQGAFHIRYRKNGPKEVSDSVTLCGLPEGKTEDVDSEGARWEVDLAQLDRRACAHCRAILGKRAREATKAAGRLL